MALETTNNRTSYSGNGVTTAFSFPYKFLADADLVVIERTVATGVEVVKTLTTHYTVAGEGLDAGGTVTMLTAPASGVQLIIYRDVSPTQELDYRENDSFPAESTESGFDKLTMIVQRLRELTSRVVKLSEGYTDSFDPTLPSDLGTVGATIIVNPTGDGFVEGPTADTIEDASADAAAAAASAAAALVSETNSDASELLASQWATLTSGLVAATDNSAKAYAIGGTGVTDTAAKGAAKEWATKTSGTVDTAEYSAKEYAQGTQAGVAGSAKDWAQKTSAAVTASLYSAKEWAQGILTRGVASGGSAKDWANYTGGTVDDTEFSAKQYALDAAAYIASILTNNNTWTGTNTFSNLISFIQVVDNTTTGAGASVTLSKIYHVLTNASLTSINNLAGPTDGKFIILANKTGAAITITNNSGGTAANRIFTGTGGDLNLKNNAALILIYDSNAGRWQVVGGSGGGQNSITSSLALAAGFQISINTNEMEQTFLVQGASASVTGNAAPFGATPPPDGAKIHLIGNDDTNTVIIPQNDAADGCLMDGDREIAKGQVVSFMYSSTLDRYVRMAL